MKNFKLYFHSKNANIGIYDLKKKIILYIIPLSTLLKLMLLSDFFQHLLTPVDTFCLDTTIAHIRFCTLCFICFILSELGGLS